jgi:hypothetical protein
MELIESHPIEDTGCHCGLAMAQAAFGFMVKVKNVNTDGHEKGENVIHGLKFSKPHFELELRTFRWV